MFIRRAAPLLLLTACTQGPSGDADILAIGDSLLDFNTPDEDVTSVAAEALGMSHEFAAIGGTRLSTTICVRGPRMFGVARTLSPGGTSACVAHESATRAGVLLANIPLSASEQVLDGAREVVDRVEQ